MTNKGILSLKRKRYYTMIWLYKKRRQELRARYGITVLHNGHRRLPDEYKEKAKRLNKKIGSWNREIRKIDTITGKVNKLKKAVMDFTGEDIHNQVGLKVPETVKMAKFIYYKFGLENGIMGILLSNEIGSHARQPSIYRTRFTRSFKTIPENKQKWLDFKDFYERLKIGCPSLHF